MSPDHMPRTLLLMALALAMTGIVTLPLRQRAWCRLWVSPAGVRDDGATKATYPRPSR